MSTTTIEWVRGDDGMPGVSWNPQAGCSVITARCTNCYTMTYAERLSCIKATEAKYRGLTKCVNAHKTSGADARLSARPPAA